MKTNAARSMQHNQYREGLLERLRLLLVAEPDISLAGAREKLRPTLTEGDIDLLFDNWLNANFDRIEVKKLGDNSHTATIRPTRHFKLVTEKDRAEAKRTRDGIAARVAQDTKDNLFQSFAAHIWETVLPNGVTLRRAKGRDAKHAKGWFAQIEKFVKPSESIYKKLSTRQLFNLAQREM